MTTNSYHYLGRQHDTHGGYADLYEDHQTGSTFSVREGEAIEDKQRECRARFGVVEQPPDYEYFDPHVEFLGG